MVFEKENVLHAERHLWLRTKQLCVNHILWSNKNIDAVAMAAALTQDAFQILY
jgi:hypothetical protein